MTITGKINGKPAEIELPISFVPRLALKKGEAAIALGVCPRTVWRLAALGEITKASCGTYPVSSLNAYLEREAQRKSKRTRKAVV